MSDTCEKFTRMARLFQDFDIILLTPADIRSFCSREIHDNDIEEEIREAFRVFDREGHGFITVPDLTHVLQTLGEKLSSEETQVIFYFILGEAFITCFVGAYLRGGFGWRWKHQLRGVCNNAVQGKNTDNSIKFLYFDNQLVS